MSEETADVVVLGAGIVGVSTAYAARERGMSVVLVDRREPGSETSYGNAGIISSGSISPLNNPSLWKALPKYLTNRHAALRWNPALGNSERGMGRALSGQFGRVAFQAAGDRPAWVDRRIGKTAPGMDRESGSRASPPRDRLAQGVARRCGRVGEAGTGSARRIRHRQRIARPPGDLRARAGYRACLQGGPAAHGDRLGRFAGRRGQGLCADVRQCRRRYQAGGRQGDRARRRSLARGAGRWRDFGAPCRGRAGTMVR